jgi:hypothetical protein
LCVSAGIGKSLSRAWTTTRCGRCSAPARLVAQSVTLANSIRGLLKVFGLVVRRAKGGRFEDLVRTAIADQPTTVVAIIEPLLAVLIATRAARRI